MTRWFRSLYARLRMAIRRTALGVAERTYAGAAAPPRLIDEVLIFERMNPLATIRDWKDFAAQLAANAYRDGFAHGYEWSVTYRGQPYDADLAGEREIRTRYWVSPLPEADGDPMAGMPVEVRLDYLRELEFAYQYSGLRIVDSRTLRPIFPGRKDENG